jgi:hypothetical protein
MVAVPSEKANATAAADAAREACADWGTRYQTEIDDEKKILAMDRQLNN